MRRAIRNVRTDRRIFRNTASSVKSINLGAITMRGGVRL